MEGKVKVGVVNGFEAFVDGSGTFTATKNGKTIVAKSLDGLKKKLKANIKPVEVLVVSGRYSLGDVVRVAIAKINPPRFRSRYSDVNGRDVDSFGTRIFSVNTDPALLEKLQAARKNIQRVNEENRARSDEAAAKYHEALAAIPELKEGDIRRMMNEGAE